MLFNKNEIKRKLLTIVGDCGSTVNLCPGLQFHRLNKNGIRHNGAMPLNTHSTIF